LRTTLLLVGLFVLALAVRAGLLRASSYRPSEELRRGAAAIIPWSALQVTARELVPRTWTLVLSNPFDAEIELAAPDVTGCSRCIEARWEGGAAGRGGAVAIAPGGAARLVLRYTGAPVGTVGRYRLDFRLAHGGSAPLLVPLTVRYEPAVPYEPVTLSLRTLVGETAAVEAPWRLRGAPRPMEIAAWNGSAALDAVAWIGAEPGEGGRIVLVPREPWKRFQAGVVRVRFEGDAGAWQMPWRCVASSPFDLQVLPPSGGAASTLLLVSNVDRSTSVRVTSPTAGGEREQVIRLGPRERLHMGVPDLPAEGVSDRGRAELVARMPRYDFEQRVTLP